jgi:hypothetical protein
MASSFDSGRFSREIDNPSALVIVNGFLAFRAENFLRIVGDHRGIATKADSLLFLRIRSFSVVHWPHGVFPPGCYGEVEER